MSSLPKINGVGIFILEKNQLQLFTYSKNQATKIVESIVGKDLNWISVPLSDKESILVKSIEKGSTIFAKNLNNLSSNPKLKKAAKLVHKATKASEHIATPLQFNKEIFGSAIFSTNDTSFSEESIQLIEAFSAKIAIAIKNSKAHKEAVDANKNFHQKVLSTTTQLFAGEFDFEKASQKAVTDFNTKMGFHGTNIYRKEGKKLRAYIYSEGKTTDFIKKIVPDSQYRKIAIDLNGKSTIAKAGKEFSVHETTSFNSFSNGILPKPVILLIQNGLPGDLWYTSFPITSNNKLEGVLAVGKRGSRMTEAEKEATMFFCEQLALAMANITAHNKIIERFKKHQEQKARNIDPDKKPTIKFTLRISKEIERYLKWKVHNTDKSKADFLREVIVDDLIANDTAYQEFLDE